MGDQTTMVWPAAAAAGSAFRFSPSLSVFFPAYNDAPSLPSLIERTFATLRRVATDYEVIVVNDGSADNTGEVLEELQRQYAPLLRVVTHEQNRGYGAALRSGFAAATKEYIFYTDGDNQYDPAELEQLLCAVTPSTGLVNGYKIERSDPWHRVAIGWLYNRFARWLFRIRLRDIDCDFRLIRRSALDLESLRSTGGTICVELVRSLELSGAEVIEIPVHHYPRRYGRSQFFRVGSLAVTFLQLCRVFFQTVLAPVVKDLGSARFSRRKGALVALILAVLSTLAYARALSIPFISDDYLQIQLSRDYGPVSKWGALAGDALYRCRATSLVLTYWLERAAGLSDWYFGWASLLLHIANSFLVFALGLRYRVGWRAATLAACFFAISHRHSEAVVWFAAVPELLVFFFVMAAFLWWTRWLEARTFSVFSYAAAVACYLLALLSKESAVVLVPLCALAVLWHPERPLKKLWSLAPFAALAGAYFALDYAARDTHLHFHDGTFSLSAPFVETMVRSGTRLLGVWGIPSVILLLTQTGRPWRRVAKFGGAWMILTLLPYSFLTYMPRVPSRHTYLASAGVSLIVAVGMLTLWQYAQRWNKAWLVPLAASLILVHQCGYQWTVKYRQYSQRAQPTEELIRAARTAGREIHASCFPYATVIADLALQLRQGETAPPVLVVGPAAARQADAIDFCNADANGVHY
jgi:hypothetical protein